MCHSRNLSASCHQHMAWICSLPWIFLFAEILNRVVWGVDLNKKVEEEEGKWGPEENEKQWGWFV